MLDAHVRITSSAAANDVQMADTISRMDDLREMVVLDRIQASTVKDSERENGANNLKATLQGL